MTDLHVFLLHFVYYVDAVILPVPRNLFAVFKLLLDQVEDHLPLEIQDDWRGTDVIRALPLLPPVIALARLFPLLQFRHLTSAMGFKVPREMPDPVSFGYVPATDPALEHLATALSWLLHLPKKER